MYVVSFGEDDGWQSRWVTSDWKRNEGKAGNFKHTAGKWSGDPDDKDSLVMQNCCSETIVIDGSRADDFLKDYIIPDYILVPGSDIREVSYVPSCPVIVFVNSRSGGQLGAELLVTYRSLLNENQAPEKGQLRPYCYFTAASTFSDLKVLNIIPLKGGAPPKFSQRTQLSTENYQVV
ncbi:hypothetical protein POM88_028627 [Heracleum sosnowskyi]|uniref:DAGKc domain-containing protein n=1 Tax=Heracleum sosnowskyi TaxID=360622 RepID=A0AAD8HTI1_9APIA|nr:hypothetical protein POM88_028627 [Heracleum sosnowskyi]